MTQFDAVQCSTGQQKVMRCNTMQYRYLTATAGQGLGGNLISSLGLWRPLVADSESFL